MKPRIFILAGLISLFVLAAFAPQPTWAGVTERVSVTSGGNQVNSDSRLAFISADGRFVAFTSYAPNLVAGDTNGWYDVFVHDRVTGLTELVSVASNGTQGNAGSAGGPISADGRFVAFSSDASNLVPADTNGYSDIFVRDRGAGQTERVSVASDGTQGNLDSWLPSISADGRFVAFASSASNLVPDDTNGYYDNCDIFVHDRATGLTERVSVASDGAEGNSGSWAPWISADGRFVAFMSAASNLMPGDTNNSYDVFVHDRETGLTERVSVTSDGGESAGFLDSAEISADGRFVAFSSAIGVAPPPGGGWWGIFVHDRETGATDRVSVASDGTPQNFESGWPSISAEGRFVAFTSWASNLVTGDTNGMWDVFVHDRATGLTQRVSVAADGSQGDEKSGYNHGPSISADGRLVTFESYASNLVSGDTNGCWDIFVASSDPISPGRLTGEVRVRDTNTIIQGAIVTAYLGGHAKGLTATDLNGLYTIPDLAPGQYAVATSKQGYFNQTKPAAVTSGATTYVNFELELMPPIPVAPSNLTATAVSTSRINLSWADNSTNETGFKIERKTGAAGTYSQIATVGANVTSYANIGLSSGVTCYYRVRAYLTGVGNSAYSNEASARTFYIPAPPSNLTATAVSTSRINLSWADNSTNETGFKIERKTGAAGAYSQIATVGANVTSYANTGLSSGVTCYYRVRAYLTGVGNSAYSNEASASPPLP